jgi:superkiller protein 3
VEAYYGLAAALAALGRFQEEMQTYKKIIRVRPGDPMAHFHLGVVYNKLGSYGQAIGALEKAAKMKPGFALNHYLLGLSYLANGDRRAALEQYRLLEQLDRKRADQLLGEIQLETEPVSKQE